MQKLSILLILVAMLTGILGTCGNSYLQVKNVKRAQLGFTWGELHRR